MPRNRKRFQRSEGERSYRKLFIIAVEGVKTEPQYFEMFNNQQAIIRIKCLKDTHESAPFHVKKRMTNYLQKETLKKTDEAWLVIDKDNWTDEQLSKLYEWSKGKDQYGFALSNPKFEYWLLLHFEEGTEITTARECSDRLERYLPGYNKSIDSRKFTRQMIQKAIERAKSRDNPPCADWPRRIGSTTVYKLVEKIVQA